MGVCIFQAPALALAPNLYLRVQAPNLYLPALAPYLHLRALAPKFVFTSAGLQFYYHFRACVCIYQSYLLNCYLSLQPWPTICVFGPGPEFAFTLLLVVVAVVVVIAVVVICLE